MFFNQDYRKELERGWISKRMHPENNEIIILNYTDLAVYEKGWNKVTLNCRGLIINEKTKEILAKPFPKFFNFGEDCGLDLKMPKGNPTVSVKMDGSLGISYLLDDKLHWSTRGSFESDQAKIAQQIWDSKYTHVDLNKIRGITLLAEIIDKSTRVVVDYNGLSDLVLIGAIRIEDGYDFTYSELLTFANEIGMKITENTGFTLEQALNQKEILSYNEEGYVLRWGDGRNAFRLKVKGLKYLEVHRMLYGLSLKRKVESWVNGSIEDLIFKVPEEFRLEIETFRDKLNSIENEIKKEVDSFFFAAKKLGFQTRKEYAQYFLQYGKKDYLSFYFNLLDGKISNLKEYILKNYLKFMSEVEKQ